MPDVAGVPAELGEASFGVVICAFSEARWAALAAAVRSVRLQSREPEDVVVVVDHNDRLLDRARRELAPVRVIASDGRPGLSGARNTGLRAVRGAIVAFLDDDARAAPDWLEQLGRVFAAENVLGAGGWIEPSWEGAQPRWGFGRGLAAGVRGEPWGFARAASIACALTVTALGYARGRLGQEAVSKA